MNNLKEIKKSIAERKLHKNVILFFVLLYGMTSWLRLGILIGMGDRAFEEFALTTAAVGIIILVVGHIVGLLIDTVQIIND